MQSMGRTLQNWRESRVWFYFFFFLNSLGIALMELHGVFFWKCSTSSTFLGEGERRAAGKRCCVLLPDISVASSLDGFVGAVSLWKGPPCVLRNKRVLKSQPVKSWLTVSCRYSYCQIKRELKIHEHISEKYNCIGDLMGTWKGRGDGLEVICIKAARSYYIERKVIKCSVFKMKWFNPGHVKKRARAKNLEICKTLIGLLFCALLCLDPFYTSKNSNFFFYNEVAVWGFIFL